MKAWLLVAAGAVGLLLASAQSSQAFCVAGDAGCDPNGNVVGGTFIGLVSNRGSLGPWQPQLSDIAELNVAAQGIESEELTVFSTQLGDLDKATITTEGADIFDLVRNTTTTTQTAALSLALALLTSTCSTSL